MDAVFKLLHVEVARKATDGYFFFFFLYFPVAGNKRKKNKKKRKKNEKKIWCKTELGYCPMKLYCDMLKEERLGAQHGRERGRAAQARAGALGAQGHAQARGARHVST